MPGPRTTWRDIAGDLRGAIARGDYGPGDRLPSRSQLMERYGVAPQTVVNALNALRNEGLVVGLTGSGYYVRRERIVMRRHAGVRLSRAERASGRGPFTSDAHAAGWVGRVDVEIRVEPASDEIAAALELRSGVEVLMRDRVMFADDEPVQLATSYLPRDLTASTVMEMENTGSGGIYARLEEAGHRLARFTDSIRIGQASEKEAERLAIPLGAPLFRIQRTAYTEARPVEVNVITAVGERFELFYELPAQ